MNATDDSPDLGFSHRVMKNGDVEAIDFGSIIVHIFTEDMRNYYQLEKLWGDSIKYVLKENSND